MLRCQFLCHVLKALIFIKIALKLSYFCKKMQNFRARGIPPPDPHASGGWWLFPQTPSLRQRRVLHPDPIGLHWLGVPPPDSQKNPSPLRIPGYAPVTNWIRVPCDNISFLLIFDCFAKVSSRTSSRKHYKTQEHSIRKRSVTNFSSTGSKKFLVHWWFEMTF